METLVALEDLLCSMTKISIARCPLGDSGARIIANIIKKSRSLKELRFSSFFFSHGKVPAELTLSCSW